jgi:signal transduction histidine kinase
MDVVPREHAERIGRRYIVCVDDDRALLDGLTQQLEGAFSATHEIEATESAQEALELMQQVYHGDDIVEMVISDQVMPGMKGDELLTLIHQEYPKVITVMLTGQAGLDSAIYAINNAGLSRYLVKPWNDNEFLMTIRELLENYYLEEENARLFRELQEAYQHLRDTQDQLVHSEKLAVVGKLTAGIAHEIRNQLTILGYAEVIKMAVPDNQQVGKYVQNILDTRNRILSIVDEIRQFARNQTQSYEKAQFLLTNVINTALNIMSYDKEAKRRTIEKDYQVSPVLTINRDKIIQVLINLIRNAIQATSDAGTISVRVAENQHYALIDIADDGCGISPEHIGSIWQPFFTTKGEQGTGLGLDICKRIIEGHNGHISCQSDIGAGTTFTIELPLDSLESEHTL